MKLRVMVLFAFGGDKHNRTVIDSIIGKAIPLWP